MLYLFFVTWFAFVFFLKQIVLFFLAKKAIICYVMKGLEAAKMQSDCENPNVQKVLSYLQVVEEVKHQTDQQSCARLIEAHKLPLGVAPHTLLKSAEVSGFGFDEILILMLAS